MNRTTALAAVAIAAFGAGIAADHLAPRARAQSAPPFQPAVIDLAALTDADLGNVVPNLGTLRSRTLVVRPQGTMAVQTGNVPKHTHADADEFQYVISGNATFWLGDTQREVHAGDLIVIPRGTAHAGTITASGELKVLAIKLPPQAPDDLRLVP